MALGLEVEFAVLNHEGARHIAEPACLAFIPEVFRVCIETSRVGD